MALDSALPDEARDYLGTLRRATLDLLAIVNDILDCAKIESGKVTLEAVDVSLRSLLAETVELLKGQAQGKGLALTYTIGAAVPGRVRADPGRLKQVLMNLIGNAIKFTQRGGVIVNFELLGRSTTDVRLRGTVRDSGIGIPPDRQKAIFESFTQADDSTTRIYGGTGLGLTICQQLVGLMGGRIGVESEPGRGSTFWFEIVLPLASPDRAADEKSAVAA
jgi:signal transduction histidine kinase